jgi:hypothetical protein
VQVTCCLVFEAPGMRVLLGFEPPPIAGAGFDLQPAASFGAVGPTSYSSSRYDAGTWSDSEECDRIPRNADRRALYEFVLTTMEGGEILTRSYRDVACFDRVVAQLPGMFNDWGRGESRPFDDQR